MSRKNELLTDLLSLNGIINFTSSTFQAIDHLNVIFACFILGSGEVTFNVRGARGSRSFERENR